MNINEYFNIDGYLDKQRRLQRNAAECGISSESSLFAYIETIIGDRNYMGLVARKPVFGGLRTTKTQTSLPICAV